MWNGSLPSIPEREALRAALASAQGRGIRSSLRWATRLSASDSMEALRAAADTSLRPAISTRAHSA